MLTQIGGPIPKRRQEKLPKKTKNVSASKKTKNQIKKQEIYLFKLEAYSKIIEIQQKKRRALVQARKQKVKYTYPNQKTKTSEIHQKEKNI
ncbi:44350_t:CDS:1, partial [Gigaspora margarita]